MAGHSKWSQIKRKKEVKDKARGALFAKLSRAITITVVDQGNDTDPKRNIPLRLAIDKARSYNMPKDTIARAIEKGTAQTGVNLNPVLYEGYGPGGTACVIKGTTDNVNRTVADVRNVLERHDGKLADKGSVLYMFDHVVYVTFPLEKYAESDIIEYTQRFGAIDIDMGIDQISVVIPYTRAQNVQKGSVDTYRNISIEEGYHPHMRLQVSEKEEQALVYCIRELEELDDIEEVFTNLEYS
jgi:YebC/PmpR family DNA-binding regulatory protein